MLLNLIILNLKDRKLLKIILILILILAVLFFMYAIFKTLFLKRQEKVNEKKIIQYNRVKQNTIELLSSSSAKMELIVAEIKKYNDSSALCEKTLKLLSFSDSSVVSKNLLEYFYNVEEALLIPIVSFIYMIPNLFSSVVLFLFLIYIYYFIIFPKHS